ncbi:protein MAIN-LIKE 2-like [Diospyros lotus]|uniref:protein MAIN-LIKE 2-like n=1 Tax=Diospyros lotus TaxID=55363 RepID=UPI0022510E10|nr:protein MAIN-LIKE 2-like [Diospyros lotus]
MTITLDDVAAILKIPITGRPISIPHLTITEVCCTLFVDKSETLAPIAYLALLDNLNLTGTYSWGSACLAYLYRQLGIANKKDTKEVSGYLTLLEVWIYEHFPFSRYKHNLAYTDQLPRAHSWIPVRDADKLQSMWEQLDDLAVDQCGNIIEPYHPEKVLRQFGHV